MGDKKIAPIPAGLNFVFGGTAGCMATCIVHPMDVLKNRMQVMVQREKVTSLSVLTKVYQDEGFKALYKGLTAGIFRQATYSSARLGVYNWLFELAKGPEGHPPNFAVKASCGMVAGAFGAFIGNPAEICLIRMTTDGRLPPNERRNYTHVFNAMGRIIKEEGVLVLWRGTVPTCLRAIVVNACQLGTYSQAKEIFARKYHLQDGLFLHFCASMLSGMATTIASMPLDIVKTRLQNMKYVNGVPEYKGSGEAFMRIIKLEGPLALWKGFTPYYCRLAPHTVFLFIFFEQLQRLYRLSNS